MITPHSRPDRSRGASVTTRAAMHTRVASFVLFAATALVVLFPRLLAAQTPHGAAVPAKVSVLPLFANGSEVELNDLTGIHLTKLGAVLISDSKPVTVRVREGARGEVRQIARTGAGPGEYRSAPDFTGFRSDSLVAYDGSLQRWSVLSPQGEFIRVLATGVDVKTYETAGAFIADGAMVFTASIEKSRAPLAEVVRSIVDDSPRNSAPIVIRQATSGDLWAAAGVSSRLWTVYDRAGRRRTALSFPAAFRFNDANDSVAVGQSLDGDEIPQLTRVMLRGLPAAAKLKSTAGVAAGTMDATESERADSRKELTGLLMKIVMKQEGHYADSSRYTMLAHTLQLSIPPNTRVDILQATNRGWFATTQNTRTHVTCAMYVGGVSVIGWSEARPHCSQ